jgi:hypothetical protein
MQIHRAARRRRCHDDAMQFHRKAAPFRAKEFLLRARMPGIMRAESRSAFRRAPVFRVSSLSVCASPVAHARQMSTAPQKANTKFLETPATHCTKVRALWYLLFTVLNVVNRKIS